MRCEPWTKEWRRVIDHRNRWLKNVPIYDKLPDGWRIVRRKLYADASGNEYVRLGRFNDYEPDAHVTREWFCDHILRDGAVER